jgi:hypothetical protein
VTKTKSITAGIGSQFMQPSFFKRRNHSVSAGNALCCFIPDCIFTQLVSFKPSNMAVIEALMDTVFVDATAMLRRGGS